MPGGLLLPFLLLAAAFAGGLALLAMDARARRFSTRLEQTASPGGYPKPAEVTAVQIARPSESRWAPFLRRWLRFPSDLPLAHVVPGWIVVGIGVIIAPAAAWIAGTWLPRGVDILAGGAAGLLLVRGIFSWERARYADKLLSQMPDAIELVVSVTRAGLPVIESFRSIAREMPSPTRDEFVQVVNDMGLGIPANTTLLAIADRTGVTEYAIFAVTLAVQGRSGGRLAETIQSLAETVRQRVALAARTQALAAEAKLSAQILSALPFVAAIALSILHPGYLDTLLYDPRGQRLFYFGIVSLLFGIFTMRALVVGTTRQ